MAAMAPALELPPRGASTASACLDDLTAKLTDPQAELAAAQDKAEASSAEVLMLAKGKRRRRLSEAERRARGLLARLRAAWRGQ